MEMDPDEQPGTQESRLWFRDMIIGSDAALFGATAMLKRSRSPGGFDRGGTDLLTPAWRRKPLDITLQQMFKRTHKQRSKINTNSRAKQSDATEAGAEEGATQKSRGKRSEVESNEAKTRERRQSTAN